MRLALYQPDIPQNLGAAIRLAACFGVVLDVIEPCGFLLTDKSLKRAALDYGEHAKITRHPSFAAFLTSLGGARLVLVETDGREAHHRFAFAPNDVLILGRESAGSPAELYKGAAASVRIPMASGLRSLNVVMAGGVVLAEAMRQTGGWERLEG